MGVQLLFPLHIYVTIVFVVFFPIKLVQVSSSNVDYGSDPDAIVPLPCSGKYLSESYFRKHDSLVDLDFQGFLAHELPLCSCNALRPNSDYVPRLSVFKRHLIGEGSHRHLSTSVKFDIQPEDSLKLPAHFCQAVVVERLPSGVFADPFELQHLVQRGVFVDAAVFGDTNLESPSALSNRSVVEVHMDIGQNILSGNKKGLEINLELPLHARYPPLGTSGYARVEMGMPDILLRCLVKEQSQHNNCIWKTTGEIVDSNTSAVVWEVPCGNKAHSGIVAAVTFISALLCTLLIVLSAIFSSSVHFTETSKQL